MATPNPVVGALGWGPTLNTVLAELRSSVWVNPMNGPWSAVGDGVTDDSTALQDCIDDAPDNAVIQLPPGYTFRAANLVIDKHLTLYGQGATLDQNTAAGKGVVVTSDDVNIIGLRLVGPGGASGNSASHAISITGASAAAPINRVNVAGCRIEGWRQYGIVADHTHQINIRNNVVDDIWYAGIMLLSCIGGTVDDNDISNINDAAPCYGIAAARLESGQTLTTAPRCADIRITRNRIRGVNNWEGIDTHSGQRIHIEGNVVTDCHLPILVGPSRETTLATYDYAPLDCVVRGNIVDATDTDGSGLYGISFTGADDSNQRATGIVEGNIVRWAGDEAGDTTGGVYAHTTDGLVVANNTIINPTPIGISLYHDNRGFTCTGNTIIDPWSDGGSAIAPAIALRSDNNTGYIGGNSFVRGALTGKASILLQGIRINGTTGNSVRLGPNYNDAATYISDSNTSKVGYGMASGARQYWGTGTPEGVQSAPIGSTFSRTDGGAGTSIYFKESGSGNTGWIGK